MIHRLPPIAGPDCSVAGRSLAVRACSAPQKPGQQRRGHAQGATSLATHSQMNERGQQRPAALLPLGASGVWAERDAAYAAALKRLAPPEMPRLINVRG